MTNVPQIPTPGLPSVPNPGGPTAPSTGGLPTPAGGIDWNQVLEDQANDPGNLPLPAGPQNVFVKDAKVEKATTGSLMINVTFEVEDGPYKTRWLWSRIVFKVDSVNAMRYTMRKLRALGVDIAWLQAANPPLEQVAQQIIGSRAIVDVEVGEYNGEPKNDVNSIKPPLGASGPAAAVPGVPQPAPAPAPQPPATGPGAPPVPDASQAQPSAPPDGEPF